MPNLSELFMRFGLALFLGFLIGLEREREKNILLFAGVRTFALISLLGATLAFAAEQFQPLIFVLGFGAVIGFSLLSYFQGYEVGHTGITTEVVFLLAFILGGMVYWMPWEMMSLAAAVTVAAVFLLTFKPNLHRFATHVDREDIRAGLEFAVVWVVVLPMLPNRTFGPLDVLNPREIWLMVVFIAGINLGSYILSQVYGAQRGIGLTGVLGGMVSSTALTFTFARRSRNEAERRFATIYALAIALASTGMFFRVLVLAFVLNVPLGIAALVPMLIGAVISGAGVAWLWWQTRQKAAENGGEPPVREQIRSPFALRPALQFGVIFAVVLFLSKAAQVYLGEAGAYLSSVIGGAAGLDAVTLSLAKLAGGTLTQSVAMRGLAMAAASNMFFKGLVAAILGSGAVRRQVLPVFFLAGAATVIAAFVLG